MSSKREDTEDDNQPNPDAERKRRLREEEECERVSRMVIDKLGRPPRFHAVRGHYLYDDAFRVNVLAEKDSETGGSEFHMTDSFFVRVRTIWNGDQRKDDIVRSTPLITRKY